MNYIDTKKLKESVDVLKLLEYYKFEKITDDGEWIKALCPYHEDRNPSFCICKANTKFHCWSCKASGDAIQLIMDLENVDFNVALTKLAGFAGYPIDENACMEYLKKEWLESKVATKESLIESLVKNSRILELHKLVVKLATIKFRCSVAESYLKERGFSSDTVKQYELGYIPNISVYDIAKKYRFTDAEILAAGYDVPRFNHRLIFPIFDLDKNIVAISGRVLDNETQPKYTATPNSDYYKKGLFLYGLKDVVKGKPITLVEGNLDYIRLHSSGINALAQLGSALTKMQCYLIKSLTHNIILMYDGDEAGRKASMHNILPLIECGLKVFVASLPDGYDPDSYFKTGVNPIPVVQKGLEYYLREPHMQAVSRCLRTLSKLMDDSVRSEYITQLSTASGLSESSIQSELRKIHNEK